MLSRIIVDNADDLNELRTFACILTLGSLSAAARDLGVTLAVVSKRLAAWSGASACG